MNKLIIENGIIKEQIVDDTLTFNYNVSDTFFSVNNLEIECLRNTELSIYYLNNTEQKINVIVNCLDGVCADIFEKYDGGILKIRNNYNLGIKSKLNLQKFYDVKEIKQFDMINLDGEKAEINYILKTISTGEERYNLLINHNAQYTISNVINNSVNINDGKVIFDVNGIVKKGMVGSILNQNNRIVTLNQNKCQINPNLLIDENDINANHSAFVGKFKDDELFYLQSRGINYNAALKLLIKGFLFSNLQLNDKTYEELDLIIKKYWG